MPAACASWNVIDFLCGAAVMACGVVGFGLLVIFAGGRSLAWVVREARKAWDAKP